MGIALLLAIILAEVLDQYRAYAGVTALSRNDSRRGTALLCFRIPELQKDHTRRKF
jgi:hypothetical protein